MKLKLTSDRMVTIDLKPKANASDKHHDKLMEIMNDLTAIHFDLAYLTDEADLTEHDRRVMDAINRMADDLYILTHTSLKT